MANYLRIDIRSLSNDTFTLKVTNQLYSRPYFMLLNCTARQCCLIRQICRVLYNQSSFIVLDETSSYWSVTKTCKILGLSLVNISKSDFNWSAFGNQQGSTFTETNRNGLTHHIGCLITLSDRNGSILILVSTDFDHTGCLITLSDRNGPILDLVYPILIIFLT